MEFINENEFADFRELISSYEFIGYLGGSDNLRIMRAVDIMTKKDVSITFKLKKTKYKSLGVLIRGFMKHKAFAEYLGDKLIGDIEIQIYEYIKGKSLISYIEEGNVMGDSFIINIFIQILDAINYLHQHHIAHRGLNLSVITLSNNRDIKIDVKDCSEFYDDSNSILLIQEDLYGLGMCLLHMIYGKNNPLGIDKKSKIDFNEINTVENSLFQDILIYILCNTSNASISGVYRLLGIRQPIVSINRKELLFLDPLITEYLESFGVNESQLLKGVNNKSTKEFYMYYLADQRYIRNIYLTINGSSLEKNIGAKTLDFVYEALKQRRYLTNRRKEILMKKLKPVSKILNFFNCYRDNTMSKISIEILNNKRYFDAIPSLLKALNLIYQENGDKFTVWYDETNLKFEIEKFYFYESFVVNFTKVKGRDNDFIQILEEMIDESKHL